MARERLVTPPETYFEFLKTEDAKRAAPWQLRMLRDMDLGKLNPRVGTYRALRAALDGAVVEDPSFAE